MKIVNTLNQMIINKDEEILNILTASLGADLAKQVLLEILHETNNPNRSSGQSLSSGMGARRPGEGYEPSSTGQHSSQIGPYDQFSGIDSAYGGKRHRTHHRRKQRGGSCGHGVASHAATFKGGRRRKRNGKKRTHRRR